VGCLGPPRVKRRLLGLGGAELQCGCVLDELVVLLSDELPVDRAARHHGRKFGPGGIAWEAQALEAGGAYPLEPWEQAQAEEVAEREADDRRAVGVGVVALDVG